MKVLYKVGLTSQITKNLPFGAIEDIQHCRGKNIAVGASAAIRYADKAPIDIYVTGRELALGVKVKRPIDVLFLKRGFNIYFLMMTPINSESTIDPDLLYHDVGRTSALNRPSKSFARNWINSLNEKLYFRFSGSCG